MAVALDDLGGDGSGVETERGADAFLLFRADVAESADGSGKLADAHLLSSGFKALPVAEHFGIPVEELQAEGSGLSVYTVGTTDDGCVAKLEGAVFEDREQLHDVLTDDFGGLLDLEGLGGVDDVVGGEAVVQPARFGAYFFCDGSGEGDDVVLYFGFDLVDTLDVEGSALADGFSGLRGNDAIFGEDFAGYGLDFKPGGEFTFVAPDAAHGSAGIARDQCGGPPENFLFYRQDEERGEHITGQSM
jgi:hypothetical protein